MKTDIDLYMEFTELRENIINDIKKIAVFSEEKNGEIVRPIGIIKSAADYFEFEKKLSHWRELANRLNEINSVRYPINAEKFSLIPQIYLDVESFTISVTPATLSRKYEKSKIVARMERYLESLSESSRISGDWVLTNRIKNELDNMNKDSEIYYRLRHTCSTEAVCQINYETGVSEKVKIPFVGALMFSQNKPIRQKKLKQLSPRKDSFEHLGINPIPCSLSLAGHLYRESEILKARARFAEQKHAEL